VNAVVVFHGHGNGLLSRLLKPGFRHVFCSINDGRYWILIDGKAGIPEIEAIAAHDYDLAAFYREHGFTVIEMERGTEAPRGPFAVANCVGMCKAVLCVRSWAITPYQLYQHLRKAHEIPRQHADESATPAVVQFSTSHGRCDPGEGGDGCWDRAQAAP
jgi:hypothetical protein